MAQSDEPSFGVQETCIAGVVVLGVRGDLDMLTAPLLNQAVLESRSQQPRALIMDLTEVDFLGSPGMSALVAAQENSGCTRVAVVAHGPKTRRPLEMVGLHSVLSLYSTLDEALAVLKST